MHKGLRQAPPQRVPFQPDVSSTRQARQLSNQAMPQPSGAHMPNHHVPAGHITSPSSHANGFELKRQIPVALRPVPTPSSNPTQFKEKIRRLRDEQLAKMGRAPPPRQTMLPGTGFDGPNIYVRTLLALRSRVPQEQDYALHHLVKISHERGDKYRFEAFPGLADGLIEKVLEICSLFYEVEWQISYTGDGGTNQTHVLDGLNGTPDILQRIQSLTTRDVPATLQSDEFAHKLLKCNEAGLVIRNMSMLEDNAKYLSEQWPLRDFLSIALNLPDKEMVVEMKHYALDIAEQVTKFWTLSSTDPLYVSLLETLGSTSDRSMCLGILRALCRISMHHMDESRRSRPTGVPISTLKPLLDWTYLDDEELLGWSLDFLYQVTLMPENIATLLSASTDGVITLPGLVQRLGQLLASGAREHVKQQVLKPAIPEKQTSDIPDLPREYFDAIIGLDEPERSRIWLRSCFQEDPTSDVTQLQLWQAYQGRFAAYNPQPTALLVAAEFIKNVSVAFKNATAHVITDPNGVPPQRYIIRGIRPRLVPLDQTGRHPLLRCLWTPPGSYRACGAFRLSARDMFEHVATQHVGVMRDSTGTWDIDDAKDNAVSQQHFFTCNWARCAHFLATRGTQDPFVLGMHVKTHLPDLGIEAANRARSHKRQKLEPQRPGSPHATRASLAVPTPRTTTSSSFPEEFDQAAHEAVTKLLPYRDSPTDGQTREPIGVPLTAALVLRNLARNIPRALAGPEGEKSARGREWVEMLFRMQMKRYAQVVAHNRSLAVYLYDLMENVEKGMEE